MGSAAHIQPRLRVRKAARLTALVRRVVEEACNGGNLAVLDVVLAPMPGGDERDMPVSSAWAHLSGLLTSFREAVPDARWTILEQVVQGETVVTRLEVCGTFSGPLLGLAPPGRPAAVTGVAIMHFVDERLVDLWMQADLLDLLQQLAVLPPLDLMQVVTMARISCLSERLAGYAATRAPP